MRTFEYESLLFFVCDIVRNRRRFVLNILFAISHSLIFAGPTVHYDFFYDSDGIISLISSSGSVGGVLRFGEAARSGGRLLLCREPAGSCCYSESRWASARRGSAAERGVSRCGGAAERVVPRCGGAAEGSA